MPIGLWGCYCHPFKTHDEATKAAKQKFEIGDHIKHRCYQGDKGVVYSKESKGYYTVKCGDFAKDIKLMHAQNMVKLSNQKLLNL